MASANDQTFSEEFTKDGEHVARGRIIPRGRYMTVSTLVLNGAVIPSAPYVFSTFKATGNNVIIGHRCRAIMRGLVTDSTGTAIDGADADFSLKHDAVSLLYDSAEITIGHQKSYCITRNDIMRHTYDRNFNPGNQVSKNTLYAGTDEEFVAQIGSTVNNDLIHLNSIRESGEVQFILPFTHFPLFGEDDAPIPPNVDIDVILKATTDPARIFATVGTILTAPLFKPRSIELQIFMQEVDPTIIRSMNLQTGSGGSGYKMTTDVWDVKVDSKGILNSDTTFISDASIKYNIPPDFMLVKMFQTALLASSATSFKAAHPFKHTWGALSNVRLEDASNCVREFRACGAYSGKLEMQEELAQIVQPARGLDLDSRHYEQKGVNNTNSFVSAVGVGCIPFAFTNWGKTDRVMTNGADPGASNGVDFRLTLELQDTVFSGLNTTVFYITKHKEIVTLFANGAGQITSV